MRVYSGIVHLNRRNYLGVAFAKALIVDFSNNPPPLIIITTALTNRKTVSFNSAPLYLGALRRRLYFNAAARHRGRTGPKKGCVLGETTSPI